VAVVGLLVWVVAAVAWAEPQRAPWWKDDKLKAEFGLTEDQSSKIDAVFRESWPKLRSSYDELGKRETELSSMVSAADTSEADVLRQVEQVEAVRSELNKCRTVMLYKMYRVLSPDQRQKVEARFRRNREGERRGPSRNPDQH